MCPNRWPTSSMDARCVLKVTKGRIVTPSMASGLRTNSFEDAHEKQTDPLNDAGADRGCVRWTEWSGQRRATELRDGGRRISLRRHLNDSGTGRNASTDHRNERRHDHCLYLEFGRTAAIATAADPRRTLSAAAVLAADDLGLRNTATRTSAPCCLTAAHSATASRTATGARAHRTAARGTDTCDEHGHDGNERRAKKRRTATASGRRHERRGGRRRAATTAATAKLARSREPPLTLPSPRVRGEGTDFSRVFQVPSPRNGGERVRVRGGSRENSSKRSTRMRGLCRG